MRVQFAMFTAGNGPATHRQASEMATDVGVKVLPAANDELGCYSVEVTEAQRAQLEVSGRLHLKNSQRTMSMSIGKWGIIDNLVAR